ncbi:MAG: hypothetical protein H7288_13095 [Kineosporiaceae bacterium]|nr:hypothetical protein [Aeromicrobium sp.]
MSTKASALVLLSLASGILTGCGVDDSSCISSRPLGDGASTSVQVEVVTKRGLDANIIGTFDVNGGLYTTPVKELGPETDLALGTYDGTVTRVKDDLTLKVEGQTIKLSGPEGCD